MKALKQSGQFAAEECVTLWGPKEEIKNVQVLDPLRLTTQVEISVADSFVLGVKAPVRISDDLQDSPGIEIIGPKGSVKKASGTIFA
ncbi:MAG: PduL/EutD family phosphate acyltransferase [Candidatus Malihini olakiniferum]